MKLDMQALADGIGTISAAESRPASSRTSTRDPRENPLYDIMLKSAEQADSTTDGWIGAPFHVDLTETVNQDTLKSLVQKAARDLDVRHRIRVDDEGLTFWAVSQKPANTVVACPGCGDSVTLTADQQLRVHGPRDNRCEYSGASVEL
jgi:hypothetical protein